MATDVIVDGGRFIIERGRVIIVPTQTKPRDAFDTMTSSSL